MYFGLIDMTRPDAHVLDGRGRPVVNQTYMNAVLARMIDCIHRLGSHHGAVVYHPESKEGDFPLLQFERWSPEGWAAYLESVEPSEPTPTQPKLRLVSTTPDPAHEEEGDDIA